MAQGVEGNREAKPEKHPGGAPSKIDKVNLRQLNLLAADGKTDKEIAEFFGISGRSFARYKKNYPEFWHTIKRGQEIAIDKTEHSLFERANGYSHLEEVIFKNGDGVIRVQTTKHYPPDPTSMIFYLCNKRPEEWQRRQEMRHSGELALRPIMLPDNGMNAHPPKN